MKNSNSSPKALIKYHRRFKLLLVLVTVICWLNTVYAIDPDRAMSQYHRDFWGVEKGFPGGTIYAIAQTNDGYLWIGCEKGLVRFDGLNFELIHPANTPLFPAEPILGLMTDTEGSLWIMLRGPKILRYRSGKFEDTLTDLKLPDYRLTAMNRTSNGNLLLSTLQAGPVKYNENTFYALVSKADLPNSIVISIAETQNGEIWMGTRDNGLLRLSNGSVSLITDNLPDRKVNCLLPDGERNLWIGTDKGVAFWNGTEIITPTINPALNQSQVLAMSKDRQSNIWIGTETNGLLRLNTNGTASIEKPESTTKNSVTALYEDREGNLWMGSAKGLERWRDSPFVTYSASEGMPSENNGALMVDSEFRTWFAPIDGGLYRLKGSQITNITNDELDKDIVYSIAGGKGDLWIGRQRGGLTHLLFNGESLIAKTYMQTDGLAQNNVYSVHQNRDGAVWAGTLSGGVSMFKDGKFTTYTNADGLASNMVASIEESADGTMWFATPSGLNSFSKGVWQTYKMQNGLPSDNLNCLFNDSANVLWIGTNKGLAYLRFGQIHFNSEIPALLREPVFGLAEDKNGWLWITTANHVLQVEREKLLQGNLAVSDVREFGLDDGLAGSEGVKRQQSVVADSNGRIWFSMNLGISVIDPDKFKNSSSVPALVHVDSVSVDGVPIDLRNPMHIAATHQRITFNFAGLSLAVPERVKYRYLLDGFENDWSEATTTPEAVYTNLRPGSYRLRVIASNSDGVWNSEEAVVSFKIEPAFWQTWWFQFGCLVAALITILILYRIRLYRLTRQLNLRFEERLAERTRIAQELHDSLLQGFVSASMQLDVAVDALPENSPARPRLSRILQLMGSVIDEGRNTVRGLRSSDSYASLNLEQAFSKIQQELADTRQTDFRIIVDGMPRPLHPVIRDEAYRIGREALVNAFRHSKAKLIEVEVEYAAKYFRILVRDDGCGIDSQILRTGREGHWGLSGMRERAEKIGAKLKVWSRAAAGTEVELSVPNHIAFEREPSKYPFKWITKLYSARVPSQPVQEENHK